MDNNIVLPSSLRGLSLSDYQSLMEIIDNYSESPNEMQDRIVHHFIGGDLSDVKKLRIDEYQLVLNNALEVLKMREDFRPVIEVDGIKMGFITKLEDMTAGEYIDLETYIVDVQNWHRAMAVLYRPIDVVKKNGWRHKMFSYSIVDYEGTGEHGDRMKMMSAADAIGCMLFFWTLRRDLLRITVTSLEKQQRKRGISQTERESLQKIIDGINISISLLGETLPSMNW